MYTGIYRIADHIFKINTTYSYFYKEAKEYLYNFAIRKDLIEITIDKKDINKENKIAKLDKAAYVDNEEYLEYLAVLKKIINALMPLGYYLIFGSAIEMEEQGYLFITNNGDGTSSHTALYKELFKHRVKYINDKQAIVHVEGNVTYIYGCPWAGENKLNRNSKTRLKAIVDLTRSKTNNIKKIELSGISGVLSSNIYQDNKNKDYIATLMNNLDKTVEFYHLDCLENKNAVITSYKGMNHNLNFEDIITFDGVLVYTAKGTSMLPLIKESKDIITIAKPTRNYKKYDAVLFKRTNGQYVLHRIVGYNKKHHTYILVGDNQYHREKGIREYQIFGLLVSINKGKRQIKNTDFKYKLYAHLWVDFYFLRCVILKIKDLFYRAFDKIFS